METNMSGLCVPWPSLCSKTRVSSIPLEVYFLLLGLFMCIMNMMFYVYITFMERTFILYVLNSLDPANV